MNDRTAPRRRPILEALAKPIAAVLLVGAVAHYLPREQGACVLVMDGDAARTSAEHAIESKP